MVKKIQRYMKLFVFIDSSLQATFVSAIIVTKHTLCQLVLPLVSVKTMTAYCVPLRKNKNLLTLRIYSKHNLLLGHPPRIAFLS